MNTKRFNFTIFALAAAMAAALATQGFAGDSAATSNTAKQINTVVVEGNATMYGHWSCQGKADVKAVPGEALQPVPGFPGGVQTASADISVPGIECGNGTMNKHMRKALKANKNPEIRFIANKYELEDNGSKVKVFGDLTIAGVTKPVELDASVSPLPKEGIRVSGTVAIKMKEFDVKPPSLFFGALKVANEVSVKFDSVIQPSGNTQQASSLSEAR